jgi:hypothetical protein
MAMYCVAVLDSGNFVLSLCRALEKKGYVFEVISTPCQIAKGGCGYCLRFPEKYKDLVINEGFANLTPVREIYRVVNEVTKNRYVRIY